MTRKRKKKKKVYPRTLCEIVVRGGGAFLTFHIISARDPRLRVRHEVRTAKDAGEVKGFGSIHNIHSRTTLILAVPGDNDSLVASLARELGYEIDHPVSHRASVTTFDRGTLRFSLGQVGHRLSCLVSRREARKALRALAEALDWELLD